MLVGLSFCQESSERGCLLFASRFLKKLKFARSNLPVKVTVLPDFVSIIVFLRGECALSICLGPNDSEGCL